jgi:hypothetical protein
MAAFDPFADNKADARLAYGLPRYVLLGEPLDAMEARRIDPLSQGIECG